MAANEIDEVAVRLTANATELLRETDRAVDKVESEMEDLGASVDKQFTMNLEQAGEAVIRFSEEFGTSIDYAAERLSEVGTERGIFGFTPEKLREAAEGIEGKLIAPMADATAAAAYLAQANRDAAHAWLESLVPSEKMQDTLTALGTEGPEKIRGGVQRPIEDLGETTERYGQTVEETFAQKFPQSVDKAGQSVEGLDARVRQVFAQLGTEGVQQAASNLVTLWDEIGQAVRRSALDTSRSVEEVATAWEGSLGAMGLSAEQLVQVAERRFDDLRTRMSEDLQTVFTHARETGQSFRDAAMDLDELGGRLSFSVEALEAFAKAELDVVKNAVTFNEKLERMRDLFLELPTRIQQQMAPQFDTIIKLIEEGGEATQDGIEILDQYLADLEAQAEFYRILSPLIDEVNRKLREMGGRELDPLQTKKIEDGAKAYAQAAGSVDAARESIKRYVQEQGEAAARQQGLSETGSVLLDIISQLGNGWGSLGVELLSVASAAGAVLIAFKALQRIAQFLREAAQAAIDYSAVTAQTTVALNLQAAATGDVVLKTGEFIGFIDQVADRFGTTSDETLAAANALILMNQQIGLTNDQLKAVIESGTAMATVFDKNVTTVLTNLGNYISTGMRTGLDDFGLQLGQTAQQAKAVELGFGSNLDVLNETELAYIRQQLVLDQTTQFMEAAAVMTGTLSERQEQANEKLAESTRILGNLVAPALVTVTELWANFVKAITDMIGILTIYDAVLDGIVQGSQAGFDAGIEKIIGNIQEGRPILEGVGQAFKETFQETGQEIVIDRTNQLLGVNKELEESMNDITSAGREMGQVLSEEAIQMGEAYIDAANKFDEGMARIQQRFEDAMEDIDRRLAQQRLDAGTDLARDLRDLDREAAIDRLETIREYQIDEIRLREDHQLAIRQLEERYLLDLEDAVRERDARGVLNLQRRFNLEKKQREEDYLLRQKRLRENFKLELQEIEEQRLQRRQIRIMEFNEEIMDLEVQAERRREQARINRDRAERNLLDSIKRRLDLLQEGAEGELEIQQQKLKALRDALLDAYGPNGWHEQLYQRAVKVAQSAATAMAAAQVQSYDVQAIQSLSGVPIQSSGGDRRLTGGAYGSYYGYRQRGGSFVATSPGFVGVGEGRPERVDITPLSGGGQAAAGFGGARDQIEIRLDVEASDLLTVEVADQTMSEIADVMVSVNQKQGGRRLG